MTADTMPRMPIEYPEPLISILTPVYNTDIDVLELCVQSVLDQTYGHWELCLVDDASPAPHVWPLLQEIATRDPRVLELLKRHINIGIRTDLRTIYELEESVQPLMLLTEEHRRDVEKFFADRK